MTTATASPVTLTSYGLRFPLPAEFTQTLGLVTIQAKNPQASDGAAASIYVIDVPVLSSLSPDKLSVTEQERGIYELEPVTVNVIASDLPGDFSLCRASVSMPIGEGGLFDEIEKSGLTQTDGGFSFVVGPYVYYLGTAYVNLHCSGVVSNSLSLDINLVE